MGGGSQWVIVRRCQYRRCGTLAIFGTKWQQAIDTISFSRL
jgi:hypothetical protein